MASRSRWSNLWKAIKSHFVDPEVKQKFVGSDYMGNKYFEREHSRDYRRYTRHFERPNLDPNVDAFDILKNPVPPAWDAWLRFRRREPPSEEEITEHVEYYEMQQERARKQAEEKKSEDKANGIDGVKVSEHGYPQLPLDRAK